MKFYKPTPTHMLIAVAVLVIAVAGLLLVLKPQDSVQPQVQVKAQSANLAQATPLKAEVPPTVAATPAQPVTPVMEQSTGVNTAAVAWQTGNPKAGTPNIPLNEKISAYTVVELQRPDHLPAEGEQIQLPMLNGKVLIADVQSTVINANGDYTWSGHLQGYGTDYPIVMTYGEHSIFATVTTPEGSYTLESLDGLGWLYKNPAEVELSVAGAKDFLEVDSVQ